MPQFAAITINDGATTPVAKTFVPNQNGGGVSSYQEMSGGVSAGYPRIQIRYSPSGSGGAPNTRVVMKITVPKVVTYNDATGKPVTKTDYTNFAEVRFSLADGSSLQERKDILAYVKNLVAHATVTSVVTGPEGIWG